MQLLGITNITITLGRYEKQDMIVKRKINSICVSLLPTYHLSKMKYDAERGATYMKNP